MVQIHQSEDKQLPNQCTCPGEPPTQVEIYNSRNAFIFQGKKEKQDTTTSLHKCWLQSPDVNVTTTALERKLYLKMEGPLTLALQSTGSGDVVGV